MGNGLKRSVRSFLKEYDVKVVTLQSIKEAIKRQGYTIVEFNTIYNDESVTELIEALELEEYCKCSKGFTYADAKYRLVFLHEDLSEAEKLMVLAHEEGHIYCGHISSVPIIGRDVVEEHEANEFAHYLLFKDKFIEIRRQISLDRKKLYIILVFMILMSASFGIFKIVNQEKTAYKDDFYITSSGSKYHREQCIFVKGKTTVHRMSNEEFESGQYEPCNICLPHDSQ